MLKRIIRILLSRRAFVLLMLVLQFAFMCFFLWNTGTKYKVLATLFNIISVLVVLYIINRRDKPSYKITWVAIILVVPLFGGLMYLLFKLQSSAGRFKKLQQHYDGEAKRMLVGNDEVFRELAEKYPEHEVNTRYLTDYAGFPVYKNTSARFLSPGEEFFPVLLEELKKAQKFIFIEVFIIERGVFWDSVLAILRERVAHGVDVRLIYDDVGCFTILPENYDKFLESIGIKCTIFNPFRPLWTAVQNNRDHRKIIVVDGKVAFTGGTNLADEYINKIKRFGYWKDANIMLCGEAVWTFTVMFLQMWHSLRRTDEDYLQFRAESSNITDNGGYYVPYADTPLDHDNVGEHVYMQIINSARDYLYIETPYLVIDDSMVSCLLLAAKRGVDIRIVVPSIPDKWLVYQAGRSYFPILMAEGIKIYEYTPGFIHSKVFLSDDSVATVGTINVDFRSLYLHFECGTVIYDKPVIEDIKSDFADILSVSHEITEDEVKKNLPMRMLGAALRICAPLM